MLSLRFPDGNRLTRILRNLPGVTIPEGRQRPWPYYNLPTEELALPARVDGLSASHVSVFRQLYPYDHRWIWHRVIIYMAVGAARTHSTVF
jgi:hypothetical protein